MYCSAKEKRKHRKHIEFKTIILLLTLQSITDKKIGTLVTAIYVKKLRLISKVVFM